MADETAQADNASAAQAEHTAALLVKTGGNRIIVACLIAVAVVFGAIAGWQWFQISTLKQELATLKALSKSSQQNDALLAETINSNQQVMLEQFNTLSNGLEQKIVSSAAQRLDQTVDDAIGKLSAFGNARFAFQMVEFDRRSCVNGGVFTGEHLEGELQQEQFAAGAMVQVLPTHTDIRGIPFYRVSVNDVPLQWQGTDAEFRHGSMRISCN